MGQPLDELRYWYSWVYQCLVGFDDLVAAKTHRANLQDLVAIGIEASGLKVQGYIDLIKGGNFCIKKYHLTPATTSHTSNLS